MDPECFCPVPDHTLQVVPDPDPTMVKRDYVSNLRMVNVSYIMLDCSKAFYAFGSGTIIPGPEPN